MELFRGVNVDWLGKKWYFLAFSLIFSVAGVLSILFWHGIRLGIDFRGGTLVYVQFDQAPNLDRIRQAIDRAGIHDSRIQTYGTASQKQVAISLALVGAIAGEFVASNVGLGYVILTAQGMMQTTRVFAAVVLLGVLGTLLFYAVSLVEYFAIPWHVSQRSDTGGH